MPDETHIPLTDDQVFMLRRCILSRVVFLTQGLQDLSDTDSTFGVFEELMGLSKWGIDLELNGYFPIDYSSGDSNGAK